MADLSISESTALAKLESEVEQDLKSYVRVGLALQQIRDDKLYRGTDKTFKQYCDRRWGMSKTRAYQLLDMAEVIQELTETPNIEAPVAATEKAEQSERSTIVDLSSQVLEGQLRELKKVPAGKRAEVMKKAAADAPKDKAGKPKVTAAQIKRAAAKAAPLPQPEPIPTAEPPTDENGTKLIDREGMIEAFEKRAHFDQIIQLFTNITKQFNQLGEANTRYLRVQQFQADAKNARSALTLARPFAVCPYCQGQGRHHGIDCNGCKGCGWVTKSIYDNAPSEMRV